MSSPRMPLPDQSSPEIAPPARDASLQERRRALRAGATLALLAGGLPSLARATADRPPYLITPKDCLLVIDVQKCFTNGGTLAVKDGDAVVPVINKLAQRFSNVVITQDWHTAGHVSFASSHQGRKPFETTALPYGKQVLWPDHCVQGTPDAALHPGLDIPQAQLILRKGYHPNVDSYSAFLEADRKTRTGLAAYLKAHDIQRVFVVGLATDFCVAWTALDARKAGFKAVVVEDATRAIDTGGSLEAAWKQMNKAGVERAQAAQLLSK